MTLENDDDPGRRKGIDPDTLKAKLQVHEALGGIFTEQELEQAFGDATSPDKVSMAVRNRLPHRDIPSEDTRRGL